MNSTLIQTDRFTLSETERSAIEHELHHYEDPRAASNEDLKIVQKELGWVPDGELYPIGEILGIPDSDDEGVDTIYSQIFRQPVGRNIIRVCLETRDVLHWLRTREYEVVRACANEFPENLSVGRSGHLIDGSPPAKWPLTSTVVT